MRALLVVIVILLTVNTGYAQLLMGQGFGKTEQASRNDALADLSAIVKVRVYSKYEQTTRIQNGNKTSNSGKFTRVITDSPLISPRIETLKEPDGYSSKAYIDSVTPYQMKLSELAGKIDKIITQATAEKDATVRYELLMTALPLYDEYDSYANVMFAIGSNDYQHPTQELATTLSQVINLRQSPTTLDMAAMALTYGITEPNIFVNTPLEVATDEATTFGIFFQQLLASKLKSVNTKRQSNYGYSCTYANVGNDLQMICSLTTGATVLRTSVVEIPISLLGELTYTSMNKNVTSMINQEQDKNTDLRIAVRVVSDSGSLVIKEGEKFSIEVKLNEPAFIYMAGYSTHSSNVLELGLDDFYRHIPASQKGAWVNLGSFTATKPFGTITLQVFATDIQPTMGMLPKYAWNDFESLDIKGDTLANDLIALYNKISSLKATAHITVTTVEARK